MGVVDVALQPAGMRVVVVRTNLSANDPETFPEQHLGDSIMGSVHKDKELLPAGTVAVVPVTAVGVEGLQTFLKQMEVLRRLINWS